MRGVTLCVAALLVAQIGAWTIPYFSSKSADTPFLHHSSPAETDPAPARAKRQAYQVYAGDDVSVTVDKSGKAETGNWGPWTPEKQCSRTCGGGVQIEKRQCSGDCTGPSTRYVSCNTDECPSSAPDFRAEQCSKYNDEVLDGNYYKWLPYKGKNKCELLCKPESGSFYYKWAEKVVDGTKCDAKTNDICVDGVCLPLGCDGKLGSAKKADKCGVCDGDGSTCKTLEGIFDERNLSPGYHDIIKLPVGATNIKIEEMRDTTNNLALKNDTDFFLNGNSMLSVEKDVEAAGTVFEYDDAKKEKLFAKGPLKEEVTVSLLFRKGNKDSAIKYEFSVPLEEIPYVYKGGDWSSCSVTCGKGVQTRDPYCIDVKTQQRVDESLCEENNSTKPEHEKTCTTVDCEAEWFEGEWETCSSTCGQNGEQYRVVYCHQIFADGKRITVDDGNCTAERPAVRQSCNRFSCPEWQAGPWSACSEKCGDAFQYRSVTCRSEKEEEEGKLLPAESCSSEENLEDVRPCNLGPCEGLTFFTSDWKLCEKCNDTEETREVTCKDNMGRAYPLEKCLTDNSTEIPIDTRTCATVQPCVYEWTTSAWSKCSTECGHGHKSRKVFCAIHQLGDLEVVDESHCQGEKPEDREECTNEEKCTGTWFTGPWTQCTEECGGGEQTRYTVCLNYDKKPVPEWCDEKDKPKEEQECNVEECPTCFDSEFGCCPDNSTFAQGEFNFGCSNCSTSEFGCCADNYTEATGAHSMGCPEYVTLAPENITLAETVAEEGSGDVMAEDEQVCTVTSGEGEEATVSCALATKNVTAVDDELFGNETAPENVTLHCSKTEFGCCPDWYTPAEGKNNQGCPEFVLGACNGTEYGCCPDEVTMSRGPNFEACGEPSCAASLYGCCKDRKTIAFGPHYAGCERSSFPCELSPHGCCPDGETAALGQNGTGCGENCLTTKYGCCPDGVSVARGHHNEGCGCEFAQYGCCPDGKSVAKGAGFYGCPEGCAQSQFGCCPDGKTSARGPNKEGCPCQYTRYGCCPDGETTSLGPRMEGCDDCRYAKHGCCPDGESKALGPSYQGCPSTTIAPFLQGGTVAPSKIQACALPQDQGTVCAPGYKLMWNYDAAEGRCSQFWYGGCDGNENRFATKEMCETICVEPPSIGRCYLPKMEGPLRCDQPVARYWYDHTTKQCAAFWWRGCLGNANNFESWEECSTFCKDVGPIPLEPVTEAPVAPQQQRLPEPTNEPHIESHPVTDYPPQPVRPEQEKARPLTLEEVCRSTQDSGPCSDYTEKYFFDAFTGKCQKFIYGGCGGNLNRFGDEQECLRRCGFLAAGGAVEQAASRPAEQAVVPPVSIPLIPANPAPVSEIVRHEDPRRDPSHPDHQSYVEDRERAQKESSDPRRDPAHSDHQKFLDERKKAHEERHQKILEQRRQQQQPRPEPQEPQDPRAHPHHPEHLIYQAERQHVDELRKQAQQAQPPVPVAPHQPPPPFVRSGKSREACQLPADNGKCKGSFRSWYFEVATGQCEQFTYTGCGGNANRFHSKDECEGLCVRKAAPSIGHGAEPVDGPAGANSVCEEAKDTGPCTTFVTKWYYNKADGTCNRFHYGGCDGTSNRFDNEQTCKAACANHQDACSLPKVQGPCSGKHQNYFFNQATQACESFVYGGCLGNTNRFATIEECQARCGHTSNLPMSDHHVLPSDVNSVLLTSNELLLQPPTDSKIIVPEKCHLPKEVGLCKASIPMFYFDHTTNRCIAFYYGGCGGNLNKFPTIQECENECAPVMHQALTMAHPVNPDIMPELLPEIMDLGTLDNEVEEEKPMQMEEIQMQNDEGVERQTDVNLQNMDSDEENAFQTVAPTSSHPALPLPSSPLPELCLLPEQKGACHGNVLTWRYDSEQGRCVSFMYTGCEPNANHFESEESCERACGHSRDTAVCVLPQEVGHCDLAVSKWFYDVENSECKLMMWSGCGGNGNRFSSREECNALCTVETSWQADSDICSLPSEAGPCRDDVTQWYWDNKDSECRQFTYGGCRGNMNKFNTKEQCEARCNKKMESLTQVDPTICHLPFEKGPCDLQQSRWFYDFATGSCKPFMYGGCEGNTNNFESESHCLSACSRIGDRIITEKRHTVKTHTEGPFKSGSEIQLTCEASGTTPIVWFKDGNVLMFSHRIMVSDDFVNVNITEASPMDSGEYYCAVGPDGILSETATVKVTAFETAPTICFDKGSSNACHLTVRMKLCDKKRYFQNCCQSCSQAGYQML